VFVFAWPIGRIRQRQAKNADVIEKERDAEGEVGGGVFKWLPAMTNKCSRHA
jgi:hypothetical protein